MSAPKRIQLRRTKGWRKPDGVIVVARPSKWGNPITLANGCQNHADQNRRLVVIAFTWLVVTNDQRGTDEYPSINTIRAELAGHDLACWCPLDQPCHADVLLELANGR